MGNGLLVRGAVLEELSKCQVEDIEFIEMHRPSRLTVVGQRDFLCPYGKAEHSAGDKGTTNPPNKVTHIIPP